MVTDKKVIEEVAKRYCKETGCTQKEASLIEEGFKEGAHWAIKEFKKSLWHDASEEPEKNKCIIEEYFDGYGYSYEIGCPAYSSRTWTERVKVYGIRKWCYIEELLPKEGGNDV